MSLHATHKFLSYIDKIPRVNLMTRNWNSKVVHNRLDRVDIFYHLDAALSHEMQSKSFDCCILSILISLFWRRGPNLFGGQSISAVNKRRNVNSVHCMWQTRNEISLLAHYLTDDVVAPAGKGLFNTSFNHAKTSLIKTQRWQLSMRINIALWGNLYAKMKNGLIRSLISSAWRIAICEKKTL